MRRLLGRSKLKLTILLFLITISLILGRLTISGFSSYHSFLGRQRHDGRLPNIKLFDIPYDTIRRDQPRSYGADKLSNGETNAINVALVSNRERTSENINKNIETSSKKIIQNGEIRSDDTVTLVKKRNRLKDERSSRVNTTFQNGEKSKVSEKKVNKLRTNNNNSTNNSEAMHLRDDVIGHTNITSGFRFPVNSSHVLQTEIDNLNTTTDAIMKNKSSSLLGYKDRIDERNTERVSSLPLPLTTPRLLNPHSFQFIMDANDLCSRRDPPFLLVLVMSIHDHMDVRNAIRQTWGAVTKGGSWPGRTVEESVKLAFLLGLHQFPERESILITENEKHGDIIQENFVDSYYNLSIKMVMGLKWASQYCPGVQFILKADEDTFVNLPMLVDILRQPETPKDTIIGRIMPESKVYRVGKWSVDKKVYAGKVYPPYAAGNTYVIPGSLARKLYKASERHLYIHVEDAFITGLLARAIGASHLDMPGFTCQADSPPQTCDFVLDLKISGTKANMGLMRHIWSQIKKLPTCDE